MQPTGENIRYIDTKNPTAGIILAAGMSTRFGRPKQLLKLKNKYLIEWVLDAALKSRLQKTVLVLGHEYQTILKAIAAWTHEPRLEIVVNHRYVDGQSSSLVAGLRKVQHSFPSVMFLLGDQPMLTSETIDRMLVMYRQSEKDICVPVYEGKRGNPTIFNRKMYELLMSVKGDIGARDIILEYSARTLNIEVNKPLCFFDIDSEQDFTHLKSLLP